MKDENQYSDRFGRMITGAFFVIIGVVLLAHKMGAVFIPSWLFTWPSILILVGLYTGVKHRFNNFGWLIVTAIGVVFLLDQQSPDLHIDRYTLPIVFIGIGLMFIARPRRLNRNKINWEARAEIWKRGPVFTAEQSSTTNNPEYIQVHSVFGGAKKIIFSKNFKGGEIVCFMGGAEVDLSQADIQGTVMLEANQIFGGLKLVVPPHWDLKNNITPVFGGIEDKRPAIATSIDSTKVLILKGACVFGGIEITSYSYPA